MSPQSQYSFFILSISNKRLNRYCCQCVHPNIATPLLYRHIFCPNIATTFV